MGHLPEYIYQGWQGPQKLFLKGVVKELSEGKTSILKWGFYLKQIRVKYEILSK